MRHLVIHGHFYQPSRENPWTGVVELTDETAPYHDWNARITAECYARNAASRILDPQGRIVRIVNNFAGISFNVGPTLFRWLAASAPATYDLILDADAASRRAQYGHGGALAQVYNHVIMPLAAPRDRVTQVRWGLRDFERRFRRRPEGMWLAETAVDLATLEILVDHGIGFTILAAHQARRVRRPDGVWSDVTEETLDVTLPYRCRLPSGRTIALFFFHGPLSRAIAFQGLLHDGAAFADRLALALPADAGPPRLLLVASDGETYGHHHRFGDMALAYALDRLGQDDAVRLTNCAAFLAAHPPALEVQIAEQTSWSCVHGIERWRGDCGCRTRDGTQQRWRAPLREGITWLADELRHDFERAGGEVFRDPWAARDEAVDLLDAPEAAADGFFRRHGVSAQGNEVRTARRLLEMQRQAMLAQSSDGWFFDDIAGAETVQILSHAARAIELTGDGTAEGRRPAELEEGLRSYLRRAPGNTEEFPDGDAVYERLVRPRRIPPAKAAAIHATAGLFDAPAATLAGTLTVTPLDRRSAASGGHTLTVGRARVHDTVTAAGGVFTFAAAHFGGHEVHCAVAEGWTDSRYAAFHESLLPRLGRDVLSEILRTVDQEFGPQAYTLNDLPPEDRRAVLDRIARPVLDSLEGTYRAVYQEHRPLMEYLRTAADSVPPALITAAVVAITGELERLLAADPQAPLPGGAPPLLQELRRWGRTLHESRFEPLLRRRLERILTGPQRPAERARRALAVLAFARDAGITINLWEAQNLFARTLLPGGSGDAPVRELADALGFQVDKIVP